jgi:hypothetical protein
VIRCGASILVWDGMAFRPTTFATPCNASSPREVEIMMRFFGLSCFLWSMAAITVNQAAFAQAATEIKTSPEAATTYWIFLTL